MRADLLTRWGGRCVCFSGLADGLHGQLNEPGCHGVGPGYHASPAAAAGARFPVVAPAPRRRRLTHPPVTHAGPVGALSVSLVLVVVIREHSVVTC